MTYTLKIRLNAAFPKSLDELSGARESKECSKHAACRSVIFSRAAPLPVCCSFVRPLATGVVRRMTDRQMPPSRRYHNAACHSHMTRTSTGELVEHLSMVKYETRRTSSFWKEAVQHRAIRIFFRDFGLIFFRPFLYFFRRPILFSPNFFTPSLPPSLHVFNSGP